MTRDTIDWQLFTRDFNATVGQTEIGLFNATPLSNYPGLDNVSLTMLPAPTGPVAGRLGGVAHGAGGRTWK